MSEVTYKCIYCGKAITRKEIMNNKILQATETKELMHKKCKAKIDKRYKSRLEYWRSRCASSKEAEDLAQNGMTSRMYCFETRLSAQQMADLDLD